MVPDKECLNLWEKSEHLGESRGIKCETVVSTIRKIHTLNPSDRSAIGANNTKSQTPKKLNKPNKQVPGSVFPCKYIPVQYEIIERRRSANYSRSVMYIRYLDTHDLLTLISQELL